MKFRKLKANEIDCRVQSVKESGVILLLYKDARCDMNILDETVGCMNWKREHTRENANCIVSVWCSDKEQWISKEDTGTESNTEKAKGLASDSFKRACFNWGIGRELYTSPFIWIGKDKCNINDFKGKKNCSDSFKVVEIEYNDNNEISKLVIFNEKTKKECYRFSNSFNKICKEKTNENSYAEKEAMLYELANKADIPPNSIITVIKKEFNKVKIDQLTSEEFNIIYKRLESKVK